MKRNQTFMPQSELAKKYLTSATEINYEQTIVPNGLTNNIS